jgi:hypothetical protein
MAISGSGMSINDGCGCFIVLQFLRLRVRLENGVKVGVEICATNWTGFERISGIFPGGGWIACAAICAKWRENQEEIAAEFQTLNAQHKGEGNVIEGARFWIHAPVMSYLTI